MFSSRQFLPDAAMARLTDLRIADPGCGWHSAQIRARRERLTPSGKLNILAADHPARRVTKVGENPIAMADRQEYLSRILRVLSTDTVDGLMASMDILEDLFILDGCIREAGGTSLLDGRVLIASLNRGGLAGTTWELDDPITGPTPETCSDWRLDGAKILLRIADDEPGSLKTIVASARAITECNDLDLPIFLETQPVVKADSRWTLHKDAEAISRVVGVASALGDSSRYLWLNLPYCDNFEIVARSTSLPILLLGGESAGDPEPFLKELEFALRAGSNVRGALVGRNVLYPGGEDPLAMACAVGSIIHQGWSTRQALNSIPGHRDRDLDLLSRYF